MALATIAEPAQSTSQEFTAGWDNFSEFFNFTKRQCEASVSGTTKKLTLNGTKPSELFQVVLNFYCSTFPATFGQFPMRTVLAYASHSHVKA